MSLVSFSLLIGFLNYKSLYPKIELHVLFLWWSKALVAVRVGYVPWDMCGHWIRSEPLFLGGFDGLDNGKHLESWR